MQGEVKRDLRTGLTHAFRNFGLEPRPHQIRTVAKIVADVASHEFAHKHEIRNYLIQHTAGSGKSLTIAALVLCLQKLKNGMDRRGFDMVLVLNDRVVLDDQLSQAIIGFLKASHVNDVVQIDSVSDLRSRLSLGTKGVIITTFQKFMSAEIDLNKKKRIAIVADEAHRTHGAKGTAELHQMLVNSAQQSELITYFSFTCSPTERTLEQFGTLSKSSGVERRRPFYSYSVEESIKDGFTLDVLSDFTHVPEASLDVEAHDSEALVRAKANYVVRHFVSKVHQLSNAEFVAKAMLVVKGREKIIQYKSAIESAIMQLKPHERFDILCTFTPFGPPGNLIKETDFGVNGAYAEQNLIEVFKDKHSKVKMIVVAEKLQTGFDAPTLALMYVDKKMKDTALVQTLGRLSRIATGKHSVCVVDFHNSFEESRAAFDKFSFASEDEKGIDEVINTAHLKNKIIENLILDLHGISYDDNQLGVLKNIAKKQKTSWGSLDMYGAPILSTTPIQQTETVPLHTSRTEIPPKQEIPPKTPAVAASTPPSNPPKSRFAPNLNKVAKAIPLPTPQQTSVVESTAVFKEIPSEEFESPATFGAQKRKLAQAMEIQDDEPEKKRARIEETKL